MKLNQFFTVVCDDKKLKYILRWLLLLSIALIPLWHIGEMIDIFNSPFRDQAALYTPLPLVIIKNLLIPTIVLVSFLICCSGSNSLSYTEVVALVLLAVLVVVSALMTQDMNIWKFMAGFRWFLPFFLIVLMLPAVDEDLVRRLAYVSVAMMILNLMMQLWQLGNINSNWWGTIQGTELAARTPGFFPLPATSAMFTIFSALFTFFVVKELKMRWVVAILCLISVFLTQSGTGFCVILIIIVTLATGSYWRICLPVIIPAAYMLNKVIMSHFRGSHYYAKSLGTRIEVFSSTLGGSEGSEWLSLSEILDWLFDADFGLGTNAAVLMEHNLGIDITAIATDSFVTQLVVNLGGVSLLIYLVLMASATLGAYISGAKVTVLWLLAIGVFSVTVTITEAFPIVLLVVVAIVYSIKNGHYSLKKVWLK